MQRDSLSVIKMIENGAKVLRVFHYLLSYIKALSPMPSSFCCQHVCR